MQKNSKMLGGNEHSKESRLISIENKEIISLLMLPAMISKYSGTNTNSANQNQTASMRGRQLDQSKSRSKSPTSPAKPFKLPIQQF